MTDENSQEVEVKKAKPRFLRSTKDGYVLPYTDTLAKRPDWVESKRDGSAPPLVQEQADNVPQVANPVGDSAVVVDGAGNIHDVVPDPEVERLRKENEALKANQAALEQRLAANDNAGGADVETDEAKSERLIKLFLRLNKKRLTEFVKTNLKDIPTWPQEAQAKLESKWDKLCPGVSMQPTEG